MQEKIPVRKVDAGIWLDAVRELLEEGKEVPLVITGNSMSPFLVHERDTLLIGKPRLPLKKGDMAFYQRENGQYVMHRIRRVRGSCPGRQYYFIGDAQTVTEGPVPEERIFGVITAVRRKGRWIRQGSFWWEFFRIVWIRMVPLRKTAVRIYGAVIKRR